MDAPHHARNVFCQLITRTAVRRPDQAYELVSSSSVTRNFLRTSAGSELGWPATSTSSPSQSLATLRKRSPFLPRPPCPGASRSPPCTWGFSLWKRLGAGQIKDTGLLKCWRTCIRALLPSTVPFRGGGGGGKSSIDTTPRIRVWVLRGRGAAAKTSESQRPGLLALSQSIWAHQIGEPGPFAKALHPAQPQHD